MEHNKLSKVLCNLFYFQLEEYEKRKDDLESMEFILMQHLNSKCPNAETCENCKGDEKSKTPEGPEVKREAKRRNRRIKNPHEPDIHDGKEIKMEPVEQLPDTELPGTSLFMIYVM